jgi:autotransporter-associated beta strand protein
MRKNRLAVTLATLGLFAAGGSLAQADTITNINWNQSTAGSYSWDDNANWVGGVFPNSSTVQAGFPTATIGTGVFAVNLGVPITIAGFSSTGTSPGNFTFSGSPLTFNNTTTGSNAGQAVLKAVGDSVTFNNNVVNTDTDGFSIQPFTTITMNGSLTNSSETDLTTGTLILGNASNSLNGIVMSAHSSATLEATDSSALSGITGTISMDAVTGVSGSGGGTIEGTAFSSITTLNAALELGNATNTITLKSADGAAATPGILNITTNSITNAGGTGGITISRFTGTGVNTIVEFSGTSFTIAKPVVLNLGNLELAPASGTQTWSGNFSNSDSSHSGNVIKAGNGTVILTGSNTYSPQTDIQAGTLLVNGTHIFTTSTTGTTGLGGANGANTGNYQIESGATLGGTGRITVGTTSNLGTNTVNAILVKSGGFIAPGSNSIGALTLDGGNFAPTGTGAHAYLNMASGSAFNFDLDGSGGTPDQINLWNYVNGDLALNGNALNLDVVGTEAPGTYTVTLLNFYSDGGITPTASGIGSGLTLGTLGTGIDSASIIYNPDTIGLQYTVAAIPEPTALSLLALGGLGLISVRRRSVRG